MRKAFAAAALAATAVTLHPSSAAAAPSPARQVAVFIVGNTTFEDLLRSPQIRSLARAGGAGLMSVRVPRGDAGLGWYLTLGTGARSAVPPGVRVRVGLRGRAAFDVFGWARVLAENRHRSQPGLLGSVLESRDLTGCADYRHAGPLVVANRLGNAEYESREPPRGPLPSVRASCAVNVFTLLPNAVGGEIERIVRAEYRDSLRVIVVQARPSLEMLEHKDELAPIVVADGTPETLFDMHGPMHSLTSDSTRRDGVVSNEDVAPTILSFFHIPVPAEMNGAVIRTVDDAPPFDLHERHLANRRMTVPIQVGIGLAVLVLGLIGIGLVRFRPRLPAAVAGVGGVIALSIPPLRAAALAAGGLPTLTYAWVVPFITVLPLGAGALALRLRRVGTLVPAVAMGVAILLFYVVEALQGWPDTLTTFFGGTGLDGNRFYGLPNGEIGLILGAALWVAAVLPAFSGYVLLVAAGLFAGFPDLGVNFGGAITFFAAAGIWYAIRRRLPWPRAILLIGVTVVAGLVVVVGANLVWSSAPTHGTRFVHNAPGRGWSGLLDFAKNRLLVGWRILIHVPLGWIPVLGLVPELYIVLRPGPLLKDAFDRYPAWRDATLATILASMVAYVVNDSGVAAAGWGFGLAAAAILYVPLVEETWRRRTATA